MNTSRKIDFEGLANVRDLGSMVTADGRKIRSGMLYRSGALFSATEKDKEVLSSMNLRRVYDFREEDDRANRPDPEIPGCTNLWIPILPAREVGVEHGEDAQAELVRRFQGLIADPEKSKESMADVYRKFVREEYCRKQYSTFLKDLLAQAREAEESGEQPAFLWHCAAGKDRAGFGSVLLQEIFGVKRGDIYDDYLLTNTYILKEAGVFIDRYRDQVAAVYKDKTEEVMPSFIKAVTYLIEARTDYIGAVYQCAEEDYGDFNVYLTEGLGFSENEQEELRRIFLE